MRKLIINADDLGADEARNEGIFEAIEAGVVTSASLLANGPALRAGLRRIGSLSNPGASFGVHINLSEGKPLSRNLRILAGKDGSFLGKGPSQQLLTRSGDPELEAEIAREMAVQIESLLDSGVKIDHLDGHQHVHVFPAVFPASIRMLRKYRIPWMRVPEEPLSSSEEGAVPDRLVKEARFFSGIAERARAQFKTIDLCIPNHFRGLYLKGRVSTPVLVSLLRGLRDGLTELMVHPGRVSRTSLPGPFAAFSTPDREKELEALLGRDFREALGDSGITLTPFPGELS